MPRPLARLALLALLALLGSAPAATSASASASAHPASAGAAAWPVSQGDYTIRDFHFRSGETLPELRLHYATLGTPRRDDRGRVVNAVMLLHGTGGSGMNALTPILGGALFKPGGLLDIARWYVILPDAIGHGGSSKPSDGLRARFPHYDYADMVEAQHRLVVEHLHVDRLRLITGISMGCMHAFLWVETWPEAVQAALPMACEVQPIAGYNRLWRKAAADAITSDPAWMGGDYKTPPRGGLRAAASISLLAGTAPLAAQIAWPTAAAADAALDQTVKRAQAGTDANDLLYAVLSSTDYDASGRLEAITAAITWINSADDSRNSPDLGVADAAVKRIRNGRFVLIPTSPKTHGHGTVAYADLWLDDLKALIDRSGGPP